MTLDDVGDDDASVLLQTYAALDTFLREMDALDALDTVPPSADSLLQQPHGTENASVVVNDGVKTESVRGSQPAAKLITIQPPPSMIGATSASRKRKHESCTSAAVSIQSNLSSNSKSIDTHLQPQPVRRRRQKDELLVLRQQVLGLETQLQSIKTVKKPPVASTKIALVRHQSAQTLAWEAYAQQEKRVKQATKSENARLKEIASKERKACFEIEKLLLKCYTSALSFMPHGRNAGLALEAHDVFLYDILEQHADARLRDLETRGFELLPSSLQPQSHESRIMLMGNQETGVEFKRSHIMPFDSSSVNKVSWKMMVDNNDLFTVKDVRVKDNMVAVHAKVTIHREGEEDVLIEGYHVFKRAFGKQLTFMTWEGLTQWRIAGDTSDTPCLPTSESGWGVVQPLLLPGAVSGTQIQVCTSALPTRANKNHSVAVRREDSVREANLLRNLIIPSMEQMFVSQQQVVENALLDDLLSRK